MISLAKALGKPHAVFVRAARRVRLRLKQAAIEQEPWREASRIRLSAPGRLGRKMPRLKSAVFHVLRRVARRPPGPED